LTASFRISDDRSELDRELVHRWLSEESYWATGRSRQTQDAAIEASHNFGAYDAGSGEQLGYARVITDGVTFAWLCDVFVSPVARGRGLGTGLVAAVTEWVEPLRLRRFVLATNDAHSLYSKFGFEPLGNPEKWMSR